MTQNNLAVVLEDIGLEFIYPDSYKPSNPNTNTFIDAIKKANKLPFNKGDFYYSDNFWDFSRYTTLNISKKAMKFKFEMCCETFRDDLKNFVHLKLLENDMKIQSIHKQIVTLYNFFNKAEKDGFYHIQDKTDKEIQSFIDEQKVNSLPVQVWTKITLKGFYNYYTANFQDLLTPSRKKMFENDDVRALKAHKENSKMPDIPKDYFDKFLSACIKISNDEKEYFHDRAIACMYIILSQTGLRVGECLGIEIGDLETIQIFNGEKAYYLKYKTWKRKDGNNAYSIQKTYVNELTKQAYDNLIEIYKEKRKLVDVNYLYLGSTVTINANKYPIDPNNFYRTQTTFCAKMDRFFPVINVEEGKYKGISNKIVQSQTAIIKNYPKAKTLAMPKNHQFRVHVCTELYNKGVPLKYIQKFMAHLSSEMEGYYVRPTKKNPQEDMNFSMETLKKIVQGETKLLGGNATLMEKINEFIDKNKYNVATDIDEICNQLVKKIPIRQKTGGVCIKSSMLRECSKDAKTNEFYCAYGVCPNIFHFYYMANISYRQTKELYSNIKLNKQNGFMRQVQKENNMLQTIIRNKLEPELEELKNMIAKKGTNSILMEYPDLKYIIEIMIDIEKEIEEWKNLK